jgi:hypothetical protein
MKKLGGPSNTELSGKRVKGTEHRFIKHIGNMQ